MVFAAVEEVVNVTVGSVLAVTSCCVSCCSKISKGTRRSGCDAVPRMYPG